MSGCANTTSTRARDAPNCCSAGPGRSSSNWCSECSTRFGPKAPCVTSIVAIIKCQVTYTTSHQRQNTKPVPQDSQDWLGIHQPHQSHSQGCSKHCDPPGLGPAFGPVRARVAGLVHVRSASLHQRHAWAEVIHREFLHSPSPHHVYCPLMCQLWFMLFLTSYADHGHSLSVFSVFLMGRHALPSSASGVSRTLSFLLLSLPSWRVAWCSCVTRERREFATSGGIA